MQSDPAEDQDDPPVKYNLKTVPACRRKKQDHEQPVLHCHTCPDHDRHPSIPGHIPHAQEHDSTQDCKNDQGINDQTDPKEQCGLPRDGACISDVFVHIYKCDRPKDQDHRKEKCSCKIHTGLFCIRHMLPPFKTLFHPVSPSPDGPVHALRKYFIMIFSYTPHFSATAQKKTAAQRISACSG